MTTLLALGILLGIAVVRVLLRDQLRQLVLQAAGVAPPAWIEPQ